MGTRLVGAQQLTFRNRLDHSAGLELLCLTTCDRAADVCFRAPPLPFLSSYKMFMFQELRQRPASFLCACSRHLEYPELPRERMWPAGEVAYPSGPPGRP